MNQYQDWTPVVFRKTTKTINPNSQNAIKQTQDKKKSADQYYSSMARKLESDLNKDIDEVPSIVLNILDTTNRNLLINARTSKNYTRIQLAKMINEHVSIIENLETGKVVNNINVLQKINRILGVNLKFTK